MGKYLETTSKGRMGKTFAEKKDALINDGAVLIEEPTEWIPDLICLVNNGAWAACAYAYDEKEMNRFLYSFKHGDLRERIWMTYLKVKSYL